MAGTFGLEIVGKSSPSAFASVPNGHPTHEFFNGLSLTDYNAYTPPTSRHLQSASDRRSH